jgi:hypothetical protein
MLKIMAKNAYDITKGIYQGGDAVCKHDHNINFSTLNYEKGR